MIVRHFLQWVQTAGAAERADATSALARAFLYSDLANDDCIAAEGAMMMLLDDPSPLVRRAMAEALADSPAAPPGIILALASDQHDIAAIVCARSPVLLDIDLVDIVGAGDRRLQAAIARRTILPRSVAAAIAEVGSSEACLNLVENACAEIAAFSLQRIVERFGHLGAMREALMAHDGLPVAARQALVAKLSQVLTGFVVAREWMDESRARRVAQDAEQKAIVTLAATSPVSELRGFVVHLRHAGQLTAGLVLRALLSGNVQLFEEALSDLSGMSVSRVSGLIHDRRGSGLRALFHKAGLPISTIPAFEAAIAAIHEIGFAGDVRAAASLNRRMVERVLTACAEDSTLGIESLLSMLRRLAMEAARDEAREFCSDLAAA